jgi:hypothetical protein
MMEQFIDFWCPLIAQEHRLVPEMDLEVHK